MEAKVFRVCETSASRMVDNEHYAVAATADEALGIVLHELGDRSKTRVYTIAELGTALGVIFDEGEDGTEPTGDGERYVIDATKLRRAG